jgi:hypothetical protein
MTTLVQQQAGVALQWPLHKQPSTINQQWQAGCCGTINTADYVATHTDACDDLWHMCFTLLWNPLLQVNLPTGNFYYVKKQVADSAFATQVLCIVRDSNPSLGARYVGEQLCSGEACGEACGEGVRQQLAQQLVRPAAARHTKNIAGLMVATYKVW